MSTGPEDDLDEIRGLYYSIKNLKEELEKEYKGLVTQEKEYQSLHFRETGLASRAMMKFSIQDHHKGTYEYLRSKYSDLTKDYNAPYLEKYPTYLELTQKLGVMSSQLRARIENPEEGTSNLKTENETLAKENKKLVKILENITQTEDFKITKEDIDAFPETMSQLILEAISSYKNACYGGCCMLCGRIFEFLVIESCKSLGKTYSGLGSGVETLSGAGKLKGKPYKNALRIAEFYRHKAVHPSKEEFDRNKAKYILSQLIFLNKEVFSKIF